MKSVQKTTLGAALLSSAGLAMAEVPAGVQTAIQAASTDAVAVGALVVAAIAALFAIRLMLRVLN